MNPEDLPPGRQQPPATPEELSSGERLEWAMERLARGEIPWPPIAGKAVAGSPEAKADRPVPEELRESPQPMAEPSSERNPLDVLADEFLARIRRGERPPLTEYTERYPELAADIRDLFPILLEMEQARPNDESPGSSPAGVPQARAGHAEPQQRVGHLPAAHAERPREAVPPVLPTTLDEPPVAEQPGTMIGPYKVIQELGEGGMGTVFMAQQTEPVKRLVALKVIKAGMDTRQVIARFQQERQALAMMDHPSIAKVFDAGTTSTGRPYFVMELVKGVPITHFCDENHLTPQQRLELFIPVCQAVQHAHQKGIIHRDLKPSNVLVALYDGKPVPKVIDFGLAKAAGQQLTDRTLVTGFGAVLGTLQYMSPEQAEPNQLDIDTRSDIYSLGVLLYELLTGTTPLDRKRLRQRALAELLRIIREDEPPRPSTRLSESRDALPSISAQRHMEPAKLTRLVRGELDWIVMKALDKDRNRRYETANGLVRDIERYLLDEPVQACPPSASYRLRKFARRNKTAFLTASLVAGALVVGTVVSTWQAVRATRAEGVAHEQRQLAQENADAANEARRKAETARQAEAEQRRIAQAQRAQAVEMRKQAETNFRHARAAVDDMYTQVAEKWLANQPHLEPLQREFLQKSLRFYAEFAKETSTEPRMRFETAMAYRRVGDIQYKLGAPAEAPEKAYRQAIDRLQKLVNECHNVPAYRHSLAATLHNLGVLLEDTSRPSEGEQLQRGALAVEEQLVADFPALPQYRADLGRGHFFLGEVLRGQNRDVPNAVKAYRSAIAIQRGLVAAFPSVARYRDDLAASYNGLAVCFRFTQQWQEARQASHYAAVILEKLVAEFPSVPEYRNGLADVYYRRIYLLPPEEQEQTIRRALAIQEKLAADFPAVANYRYDLLRSHHELGKRAKSAGRTEEAEKSYRQALPVAEKLAADSPSVRHFRDRLKNISNELSELLRNAGRLAEAERVHRRAMQIEAQLAATEVIKVPEQVPTSAVGWHERGKTFLALQQPEKALADLTKAIDLAPKDIAAATWYWERANVYLALQQWDMAVADMSKAMELAPENAAQNLNNLAWHLATCPDATARQPQRAVELARKAVERSPQAGQFWNTLGAAQYHAEAWKESLEAFQKSMDLRHGGDAFDWFFIAMCRWQLGDKEQAVKWNKAASLWMAKYAPGNDELNRFRKETAALLNIAPKGPPQQSGGNGDQEIWTLVLDAQPDSVTARRRRGEVYAAAGEWSRAAADYAQVVERQPSPDSHLWFEHAGLRLLAGDAAGHAKACSALLERGEQKKDLRPYLVARACTLAPLAAAEGDRAARLAAAELMNLGYWSLTEAAALEVRAGRWDNAELLLRRCLRDYPNWDGIVVARIWLALALHGQGKGDKARKELAAVLVQLNGWGKQMPSHAMAGRIGLHLHDWLEAQVLRREAEELLKRDSRTGRQQHAPQNVSHTDVAAALTKADPHTKLPLVWRMLAEKEVHAGRWAEAKTCALRFAEMQPKDDMFHCQLAALLARAGDAEEYQRHCKALLVRFSATRDPVWAERGSKACLLLPLSNEQLAAVSRLAERAVTLDPKHWVVPYAYVPAALAAYRRGEYPASLGCCDRAMAKESENVWYRNAPALFIRALALARLGKDAESRAAFDKATAILKGVQAAAKPNRVAEPWHDFAICELLQQEARQAVAPMRPSGTPRAGQTARKP